ncbi:MAG: hypothetical protein P8046_14725 [Anaerolineales bacterium]
MKTSKQKNPITSRQVFLLALVVFVGIAVVAASMSYSVFRSWGAQEESNLTIETPVFNALGTQITPETSQGDSLPQVPAGQVSAVLDSPKPWDGTSRVTMLVLGVDYRDWESGFENSRSDTMILLTIDPVAKTAGALSIPRDLWAAIPGFPIRLSRRWDRPCNEDGGKCHWGTDRLLRKAGFLCLCGFHQPDRRGQSGRDRYN